MKDVRRRTKTLLRGYLVFFVTIFVTVSVSLTLFMLINRQTDGNLSAIVISMLVTIVFLSLIFTLFDVIRRRIMIDRPVEQILFATEKITSGDFSVRLTPLHRYEKYDEYDLIMENLNSMAAELEKSELLKSDFIFNVSHELKTPLATIQNYAYLLKSDVSGEQKEKYIRTITEATKRLTALVTNILKLNKLENQQLKFTSEKIALHDMLADVILTFEDAIEQKGLELECDLDEVTFVSSKSNLEIAVSNLISNAVKFTERGGTIKISLKKIDNNSVKIEVSDTGCGISPDVGSRIFDKFYQGDTSHSQEGNGLGLALVKRVIDLIGGEISVSSEPGKGSIFSIVVKGDTE